jgi:arsenate reductase
MKNICMNTQRNMIGERTMTSPTKNKTDKKMILFLCFHNSARSQMAEGLLRAMYGDKYEVQSAGVIATHVDPRAVKAMSEIGIDISSQRSKSMTDLGNILFDVAVTVCDKAKELCPFCGVSLQNPTTTAAAREVMHKAFSDPATAKGSEEEQLDAFRHAREEIKMWITQTFC